MLTDLIVTPPQGPSYYPMSYPSMPKDEILDCPILQKLIMELASILEVRGLYHEAGELDWYQGELAVACGSSFYSQRA